jgi:transcriptional regulator with XRE-family HTH domain
MVPIEEKGTRHFIRSTPDELEIMRQRLIIARVMNGFSLEEAQERLGCPGIAYIEAGKSGYPRDYKFVLKVARDYSVSADFLLGLTSEPDLNPVTSARYALLRGFEGIVRQQIEATHQVFFAYTKRQGRISRSEHEAVVSAVDAMRSAIEVMREKFGFDDIRGSATVLATLASLEHAIMPLRKTMASQREVESLLHDFSTGKAGAIAYLLDEGNGICLEP